MERDRERAMLTMCVRRRTRRGWHALDDGTPGPSVPTCPSCPRLACDSRRPSLSGGGRAGTPTRSVAPDATLQRPRAGRRAPRAPATHGRRGRSVVVPRPRGTPPSVAAGVLRRAPSAAATTRTLILVPSRSWARRTKNTQRCGQRCAEPGGKAGVVRQQPSRGGA